MNKDNPSFHSSEDEVAQSRDAENLKAFLESIDELPVKLSVNDEKWEVMFTRLQAYQAASGLRPWVVRTADDPALYAWLASQRFHYGIGELAPGRVARLEATGVKWNNLTARWDEKVAQMKSFIATHGHSWVPEDDDAYDELQRWSMNQRALCRRGELSEERATQLESIGFEWAKELGSSPKSGERSFGSKRDAAWEAHFTAMVAYKQKHGHCNVSGRDTELGLGNFVKVQRIAYREGKLSPARVQRLEAIGFEWARYAKPTQPTGPTG